MHTDFPLVKLIIHRAQGGGAKSFQGKCPCTPTTHPPLKKKTLMYLLLIRLAFFVNVILSKKKNIQDACIEPITSTESPKL